jgi:hypothetical protein
MTKTNTIIDLKKHNFSYVENGFTYTLLFLRKEKMVLEVAVFQNNQFLKNDIKPFAQIPKSLKAKINPL